MCRRCSSIPIKSDTLILTMYFLWSKGENKLHFSVFWKPVVCTQRINTQREFSGSLKLQTLKCNTSLKYSIHSIRRLFHTYYNNANQCRHSEEPPLSQISYLWMSHQAHLSRRRCPGRGQHRCETAPGISRLDRGCGSACGSTWAGGWKPSVKLGWMLFELHSYNKYQIHNNFRMWLIYTSYQFWWEKNCFQ